jgi:hypothetical protein
MEPSMTMRTWRLPTNRAAVSAVALPRTTEPEKLRTICQGAGPTWRAQPRSIASVAHPNNALGHQRIIKHMVHESTGRNGRKGIGSETVGIVASLPPRGVLPCLGPRRIGWWPEHRFGADGNLHKLRFPNCPLIWPSRRLDASSSYPHASRRYGEIPRFPPSRRQEPKAIFGPSASASRQWPRGSDVG